MRTKGYIITKRGKENVIIIIRLTRTKYFGLFIPKFNKTKVIGSELFDSHINRILRDLPKSSKKIQINLLTSNKTPLSQYRNGIIKTVFLYPNNPLDLTFIRSDRIPNFNGKSNQWLVIREKNKQVVSETSTIGSIVPCQKIEKPIYRVQFPR